VAWRSRLAAVLAAVLAAIRGTVSRGGVAGNTSVRTSGAAGFRRRIASCCRSVATATSDLSAATEAETRGRRGGQQCPGAAPPEGSRGLFRRRNRPGSYPTHRQAALLPPGLHGTNPLDRLHGG